MGGLPLRWLRAALGSRRWGSAFTMAARSARVPKMGPAITALKLGRGAESRFTAAARSARLSDVEDPKVEYFHHQLKRNGGGQL